jgi:transcriptional regulator with XRE-family HTH domain
VEEAGVRKVLSANIKYFRGLRGWPQARLAVEVGISTNFLADIETGKSWVSSQTLAKLATVFEIEVHELFRAPNVPKDETREAVKNVMADLLVVFEHSVDQISGKYLA